MATSENIKHVKAVVEVLGVDKCFMYKAMKRQFRLLNMPMWSVEECVQRSNVVDKNVKDLGDLMVDFRNNYFTKQNGCHLSLY
jgi:hypothetical protein